MPSTVRDFWRGASDLQKYDYLVNSPFASEEIRRFHAEEDRLIDKRIEVMSTGPIPFAVVEEGCGPGRIITRLVRFAVESESSKSRANPPSLIVGVDFEWNMLADCVTHLVGDGGTIGNWKFNSIAQDLTGPNRGLKKYNEAIRNRVVLVQADITKPHIQFQGIVPVFIMAFGTLGNLERYTDAIRTTSEACGQSGALFVSVFNREQLDVGKKRYSELAKRSFRALRETNWDTSNEDFRSPHGFRSRWFFSDQFVAGWEQFFELEERDGLHRISDGVGLAAWLKSRQRSGKGSLSLRTSAKALLNSKEKTLKETTGAFLVCPSCGARLEGGNLPLKRANQLVCSKNTSHDYEVRERNGFYIPILEV